MLSVGQHTALFLAILNLIKYRTKAVFCLTFPSLIEKEKFKLLLLLIFQLYKECSFFRTLRSVPNYFALKQFFSGLQICIYLILAHGKNANWIEEFTMKNKFFFDPVPQNYPDSHSLSIHAGPFVIHFLPTSFSPSARSVVLKFYCAKGIPGGTS